MRRQPPPSSNSVIRFVGHEHGCGIQRAKLAAFIREWPTLGLVPTQQLYAALIEACGNTTEWAYTPEEKYREWWVLAFHRPKALDVSFCFLDLGQGIPTSIRTRFVDKIPIIRTTGAELIKKAVMEGNYSRTKKPNRGTGLPSLKSFVDAATDGELLVMSDRSWFRYAKGKPPETREVSNGSKLQGTLISWSIRRP